MGDYTFFGRGRTGCKGGGVGILVSHRLSDSVTECNTFKPMVSEHHETIYLKLRLGSDYHLIGNSYRTNGHDNTPYALGDQYFTELNAHVMKVNELIENHTYKSAILTGDFNCEHISWTQNTDNPIDPEGEKLYDIISKANFVATNSETISHDHRNIDVVFTTHPEHVTAVRQMDVGNLSDHKGIVVDFEIADVEPRPKEYSDIFVMPKNQEEMDVYTNYYEEGSDRILKKFENKIM